MKAQRHYLRRMLAYVMTLCMVLSLFGGTGAAGIAKAAEDYVYFLNSEGWSEVGAYVYGDKGEVLGGWGSTTAVAAEELGGNWLKVAVSEVPPYSIIFFNKANDIERTEQYLPSEDNVYVAMNGSSYTSQAAAESAMGVVEAEDYLYFLNTDEWSEVGAYVYGDKGEVLGGWGSTTAA
ncbi:MAG: starch-binding protein, partial [Lachnospiraceae bacterium]|nr:starch-binding protein [Lachnospiraceae bacterium]